MQKLKHAQVIIVKAAILDKRQDGKCAICHEPMTLSNTCLDHDHYTGLVRGVLCRSCNGIEGKIKNLAVRGKRRMLPKDYLGSLILYWIHHETDRTGLIYPAHKDDEEKRIVRNTKARKARAKKKGI